MEIYQEIASGTIVANEHNFKQMISQLFNYEKGSDMYTDFVKSPIFYKEFMGKDCTPFFDVLTHILKNIPNPNMVVYKDTNIITLMAAATFHMNKLHCIQSKITDISEARKMNQLISGPFASWFQNITQMYPSLDIYQTSKYLKQPYTYIILDSYISIENDKTKKILKKFEHTEDILHNLIIPITDDSVQDMYGFGLILYKKWDNNTSEYIVTNDFISVWTNYFQYEKLRDLLFSYSVFTAKWKTDIDSLNEIYNYVKTLPLHKYEVCMVINKDNNILFDIEDDFEQQMVIGNEKLQLYIANMFKLIEDSDNVIFDTLHLSQLLYPPELNEISFEQLVNETILHPIMRNVMKNPVSKNIKFVQSLLTHLLLSNSKKFATYNFHYPYNGADNLVTISDFFERKYYLDLLFLMLDAYFTSNNSIDQTRPESSPAFGYLSKNNSKKYSLKLSLNTPVYSPQTTDIKKFKEIIKIFLKYFFERKYDDRIRNSFYTKIEQYKTSLLSIDIDIDKYEKNAFKLSPVLKSKSPKRSIDKDSFKSPAKMNSKKKKDNIFYKQTVSEFSQIQFADTTLLHKLQKYYIRTISGMSVGEYDKPDRIMKIRKFLQMRYPMVKSYEYKLRVPQGKDFETLYNYWLNDANEITLNAKYYIISLDENGNQEDGIDAGGLTKSFFTNIIKQMKDKYFKLAYENSDKYILNTNDPKIAKFIGELLCVLILREIYLDFNISTVYLGHLLYDNLKPEEQFLYYLLDIDSEVRQNYYLQYCAKTYEYESEYDENYYYAMACNPEYIVKETMTDIYQQDGDIFKAFCSGFFIEKKIFYNKFFNIGKSKIRIYDVDKLLTMTKLSKKALKSGVFDRVTIFGMPKTESNINIVYKFLEELMIVDNKQIYQQMYDKFDASYIKDDKIKQQIHQELVSQQVFKQKVLQFWTGSRGILNQPYDIHTSHSTGTLIKAHTCFNRLDLPSSQHISSKQMLFDKFMEMFIAGLDSGYSDR